MERPPIEHSGDTAILTPPPEKNKIAKKQHPTSPSKEPGYLTDVTKEDYSQSLRTVEFHEIATLVTSPKEFGKYIGEREKDRRHHGREFYVKDAKGNIRETFNQEELSIIDEIPSPPGYQEFRFYIARRTKTRKTFQPETVLLAEHHEDRSLRYLASYEGPSTDKFNTLKEERFLPPEDRSIMRDEKKEEIRGKGGEGVSIAGSMVAYGGEGEIRTALRKRKGKFFPEKGFVKQDRGEKFSKLGLKPEAELIVPLQKFLAYEEPGSEYIVRPITVVGKGRQMDVKKDTPRAMAPSVFWECVTVNKNEGEQTVVLNLKEAMQHNVLSHEQKLTALLHLFRGLDFLAKHGITHNDIKPENLFLTNDRIKIGDFGLMLFNKGFMDPAYRDQWERRWSELDSVYAYKEPMQSGTPTYMHPRRRLKLWPEQTHPKYDIYSASMIAMVLLTGKAPVQKFEKDFVYDYQEFQEEAYALLNAYVRKNPELRAFIALVKKGLHEERSMVGPRNVEDMLPDAEEFVKALEAMGVTESLDLKLPDDASLLTKALRRFTAKQETTVDVPRNK